MTISGFIEKLRRKRHPPSKLDTLLDELTRDIIKELIQEEPLINKIRNGSGKISIKYKRRGENA